MQISEDKPFSEATHTNISQGERLLSLMGGAACIGFGLARKRPEGFLLAFLGGGLIYRSASGRSLLYDKLDINRAVTGLSRKVSVPHEQGIRVAKTFTINRPIDEVYSYWRNFENLPRFMKHLDSVTVQDAKHSHWVANGPAGKKVEWDAEIINESPNEVIGWRSLENADVENSGSVRFKTASGGRGTVISVTLSYVPPAGKVGATIAKLFGEEPQQQITDDLRRFKHLLEAGEIPTNDGQPSGRDKQNSKDKRSEKSHESAMLERR